MIDIKTNKPLLNLTFIDLFAGIGGFRIALESLGAKCVYSNEVDKNAIKTYESNFGSISSLDIRLVNESDIPDHDILCAGFPCQPFSISGKQKGFCDERGTLFFEILRILKKKQSKIVLLENVKNLLSHDNGRTFKVMKQSLENLNYEVSYKVLDASNFGVPQKRERLYIVCFKKDFLKRQFVFPTPFMLNSTVYDILIDDNKELDRLYFDINKLNISYCNKNNNLTNTNNKPIRLATINKGGQGERIYDVKGVAITISSSGGGMFSRTGAYYVNGRVRKLHPRECARLMGFPDNYKLSKSYNIAYKQLGNSVVVDVLQLIGIEIAKCVY